MQAIVVQILLCQMFLFIPGFVSGFSYEGFCINKTTSFTNTSKTVYGTVNKWSWDFGDLSSIFDVSTMPDPDYSYSSEGTKKVRLIVANSKGCIDTVYHDIGIFLKPPVQLAFADTLICTPDKVQLQANGGGIFSWSPPVDITGANTATPIVSPSVTTTYYVDMNQDGCTNTDSVTVNVVDHVSLETMNDTTICAGDAVQLKIISNGLKYAWLPASQVDDANAQQPVAVTNSNTAYSVTATIGSCFAGKQIKLFAVPYPVAFAGADTIICFQTTALLHATTNGSTFSWSPQNSLQFANTLNPVAFSGSTTQYILSAYDTLGCPKPGIDSVLVTVLPKVKAFAGNDTAVVVDQPLQLNASGGDTYTWFPSTGLSSINIPDPVAVYTLPQQALTYKLTVGNAAGCTDSDFVTVKVYKVLPTVFVPTGFTPNNDGRNDILKPIAVGMQSIQLFAVYNRWGQMVFSTTQNGKGWDGAIGGVLQSSGTYVWMIKAIDYAGKPYFQKGTVALIR